MGVVGYLHGRGQRVSADGSIQEIELSESQFEIAKRGLIDQGLNGYKSYLRDDHVSELGISGRWDDVESLFDDPNFKAEIDVDLAIKALKSAFPNVNIEYQIDGRNWFERQIDDPPEIQTVRGPLTDEILEQMQNGDILNARIESSHGLFSITFENGKVTSMVNGLEDKIPIAVLDEAKKWSAEKNMDLTVHSVTSDSTMVVALTEAPDKKPEDIHTEYVFLDSDGNPVVIGVQYSPNQGVVIVNSEDPSYKNVSPNVGGSHRVVGQSDGDPPSILNQVVLEDNPEDDPDYHEEPTRRGDSDAAFSELISVETPEGESIELFYDRPEEGEKPKPIEYDPKVEELQRKMLKLAELDDRLEINLGPYGDKKDGVDGKFGPATDQTVMAVQKYLDPESYPDGVVHQSFLNALDKKIEELEVDRGIRISPDSPDRIAKVDPAVL